MRDGVDLSSRAQALQAAIDSLDLEVREVGATNINEQGTLMYNQCFYLSLARAYLSADENGGGPARELLEVLSFSLSVSLSLSFSLSLSLTHSLSLSLSLSLSYTETHTGNSITLETRNRSSGPSRTSRVGWAAGCYSHRKLLFTLKLLFTFAYIPSGLGGRLLFT